MVTDSNIVIGRNGESIDTYIEKRMQNGYGFASFGIDGLPAANDHLLVEYLHAADKNGKQRAYYADVIGTIDPTCRGYRHHDGYWDAIRGKSGKLRKTISNALGVDTEKVSFDATQYHPVQDHRPSYLTEFARRLFDQSDAVWDGDRVIFTDGG